MNFADRQLAHRLEYAEGKANAAFVESRAGLTPESGATWVSNAGAFAMFDGVESPLTQTFGLGITQAPTEDDLQALETFFESRGARVFHEVSPLGEPSLVALLTQRGYRPLEFSTVLYQSIGASAAGLAGADDGPAMSFEVRPIRPGEEDEWAETAGAAWGVESPELRDFMRDFGGISARTHGTVCFLALRDGVPAAAAAMAIHEGVALLAGAGTKLEWRGQGAQGALLRARLRHAASLGCDVAMMAAAPGSASQRNAERQGFRVAYTRLKWARG